MLGNGFALEKGANGCTLATTHVVYEERVAWSPNSQQVGLGSNRIAPFASLKKQVETLFQLICCERKTLFQLKKKTS